MNIFLNELILGLFVFTRYFIQTVGLIQIIFFMFARSSFPLYVYIIFITIHFCKLYFFYIRKYGHLIQEMKRLTKKYETQSINWSTFILILNRKIIFIKNVCTNNCIRLTIGFLIICLMIEINLKQIAECVFCRMMFNNYDGLLSMMTMKIDALIECEC